MSPHLQRLLLIAVLLGLLAGCGPSVQSEQMASQTADPAVHLAHTWLLRDAGSILAVLPDTVDGMALPGAPAAPPDPLAIASWRRPPSRWMQAELQAIKADSSNAPRAARALMLLAVAMNDGLVIAETARSQGYAVSDDTLLATVAWRIIAYTHPQRADTVRADAAFAEWVGLWQGVDTPQGVLIGRLLGAAVADRVIDWATHDRGNTLSLSLEFDSAPGRWRPTPPGFAPAEEPAWGQVRTIAVGDPASLRVVAPPEWDSPAMDEQRTLFLLAQQSPAGSSDKTVEDWAGEPGSITLPGRWFETAERLIARDDLTTREVAAIFATLGVALHDSAVICWESKYHYRVARPIQWMQAANVQWMPALTTPAHPSYPAEQAVFSSAAGSILSHYFPGDRQELAELAGEAARSATQSGLHWSMDSDAGLSQGRSVAEVVIAQMEK